MQRGSSCLGLQGRHFRADNWSEPGGPLRHAESLIHNLPVAVAVVNAAGELVEDNRAFRELAEHCECSGGLTELFGAPFHRILTRAWIERHIQTTLPALSGPHPRPTLRVSFMSTNDDRTLGVVLQDVTTELEFRRLLDARDRDFAVLRDVGAVLSVTPDLDHLVEQIHAVTQRVRPCKSIYVALFDRETDTITFPRYIEEGEWHEMTSRPSANGLTEHLLRTGKALLLNDHVIERAAQLGIEPVGRPCQSWMGAPMVIDGEAIGVIGLQDYETEGAYEERDLDLLTIIASLAAAGVKNARSIIAERRAFDELTQAQTGMLETERLRGVTETVGALNHEINNPLAAIAGNAQLLIRTPEGIPDYVVQKIRSIHEAAQRIQRVTVKMASLIQASSMAYPGDQAILDVANSIARDDTDAAAPQEPSIAVHERALPASANES